MHIRTPYLLFLADASIAKTANGVRYWRPELCLAQFRFPGNPLDLGVPDMTLEAAAEAGVKTVLVGAAPPAGQLPQNWIAPLVRAMELGLDIANGLHTKLNNNTEFKRTAARTGRHIFDVRHTDQEFQIQQFEPRPGKRLLTVGTDCAVGKMFTALAIEREMRAHGMNADFRATGQTGIMIAGQGLPIDAIVSDFVSSAAASLSPVNSSDHWDIVEGQGSLFHPAYAGVTLGLVHGSQPDAMVLCTDPTRRDMQFFPGYPQPSLGQCIDAYEKAAQLTNPKARVIAINMNTSALSADEALSLMAETQKVFCMPCVDAVRTGVQPIVERLAG